MNRSNLPDCARIFGLLKCRHLSCNPNGPQTPAVGIAYRCDMNLRCMFVAWDGDVTPEEWRWQVDRSRVIRRFRLDRSSSPISAVRVALQCYESSSLVCVIDDLASSNWLTVRAAVRQRESRGVAYPQNRAARHPIIRAGQPGNGGSETIANVSVAATLGHRGRDDRGYRFVHTVGTFLSGMASGCVVTDSLHAWSTSGLAHAPYRENVVQFSRRVSRWCCGRRHRCSFEPVIRTRSSSPPGDCGSRCRRFL